jgi:hypothetical protein
LQPPHIRQLFIVAFVEHLGGRVEQRPVEARRQQVGGSLAKARARATRRCTVLLRLALSNTMQPRPEDALST